MNVVTRAYHYASNHRDELIGAIERHLLLVGIALGIGILVCVPLGTITARSRVASATVINGFNALRVIPSLAILFLALPYFGLTLKAAILALTVLALPPILINTDAAFRTIDPAIREAAYGMGMARREVLRRIEFPLAMPVIASATLAAFIGGGGLGIYITRGFALYDNAILLVGAVPVALLALIAEIGMSGLQRALQPPTH